MNHFPQSIKSKKVLGWEAKTKLDDGMKKCVEHAKKIGLDQFMKVAVCFHGNCGILYKNVPTVAIHPKTLVILNIMYSVIYMFLLIYYTVLTKKQYLP